MEKLERDRVIDKCIELITTHTEHDGSYCDTGEDIDWSCRSECVDMAVARLSALMATNELLTPNN